MKINIYRDQMQRAYLFGTPVLYSAHPIPREDVPQGWFCYDLRGTEQDPDRPYSLVDQAEENHAGSVLSYLPLKSGRSQSRLVRDMLQPTGEQTCLADFCAEENIRCPETPLRHTVRPASPEEAGLFYAQTPVRNEELAPAREAVIGRITFASGESEDFTDPREYLEAIREELPYHSTTGFRCETLTDDPEIRKAVDDIVCDFYGEEKPRQIQDYVITGMTMGGEM